jgi:tRNA(Ile)-lysidine synthetase-like protein
MAADPETWNDHKKQYLAMTGEVVAELLGMQRRLARLLPLRNPRSSDGRAIGLAIKAIFIYFKSLSFLPVEVAWADLTGDSEARLSAAGRRQIGEFLSGQGPQATLMLPKGVRLIRRGSTVWLTNKMPRIVNAKVGLGCSGNRDLGGRLVIEHGPGKSGTRLKSELIGHQLRVRTWMPGDRLKPFGRPRKKISDLLNEAALDPVARERSLVLVDDEGPLMMLGGPVDERALANATETNSLCVTWTIDD